MAFDKAVVELSDATPPVEGNGEQSACKSELKSARLGTRLNRVPYTCSMQV